MRKVTSRGLFALAIALAAIDPAQAQYPARTIRWIVPFAPGSGTDTVARFVQPQLAAALGQQVVIDNRPGFDIVRDFAPVTSLAHGSFMLAAHPSLPARSAKEFIAFAKRRPGEVNVATAGAALRLAAKMLDSMAGIQTTEINYKSTPQAITAVVSGETSVGFPATSSAMPHARAGKLRALAVTTPRRSPMAPEVPTLSESGVPGYDVTTWYGLLVPAGTSPEIIARLNGAAVNTLTHPAVKERFAPTDLEPNYSTPEQFGTYIRSEVAKWAKVIKEAGIKGD